METNNKPFDTILEDFQQCIKKPECFLSGDNSLSENLKISLKKCYDGSKCDDMVIKCNTLRELIIKQFDLEQVWQQIELQNDALLTSSVVNISKLIVNKDHLLFTNLEKEIKDAYIDPDEDRSITDDKDNGNTDDVSSKSDTEINDLDNEPFSNEDSDDENNTDRDTPNTKKSVVDDGFFNLNEMENFLKKEESKLQNDTPVNDSDESLSEEEDVDLFEAHSDSDEDNMKTARFKDYFVAKDDNRKRKPKRVLDDVDSEEDIQDDNVQTKSSLELRNERLQRRIEEIEQKAIGEKPWQLKGEITADSRPQNSLLEEIVEFDLTSRPAPIITEQTTLQLEDIIRQRIKDRAFDSVIRKEKPVELPMEYKKKLVLDQEKSKQSLAQIYEKEFLDQQASLDPDSKDNEVEPESHREIKALMKNLFHKLDSLSNFHFTPKPAVPELRVVNNLPVISMEEVAPVAASDVALLAPEEIKNKVKGGIIGKTERTSTDKKRERRKKKQKQRVHAIEKQKREENINNNGLGSKFNKEKAKRMLQQVTKDRNTGKMVESTTTKSVKSSKAFFTHLQEEVQTHIANKAGGKRKAKDKKHLVAKKMKL